VDIYLCEPVSPFAPAIGTAFTTFTAKKSIDPLPVPVIPAGKLRAGSVIKIEAEGEYSSLTGAALTLGFWFGTRALAITNDIALSSVITTGTTPAAWPWRMEWRGKVTTAGAAAASSITGQGNLELGTSLTVFSDFPIPITAALRTFTTFDTTIERAIGVSATWGASSASNSIACHSCTCQILN
jgi:hypothetical protein